MGGSDSRSRSVSADQRYFEKRFSYLSVDGLSLEDTVGRACTSPPQIVGIIVIIIRVLAAVGYI